MDIKRPDIANKKKRIRRLLTIVGSIVLIVIVFGLFTFDPGPYKVEKEVVWIGEVERGQMLRQVRGVGSLVPAEIRWVAARSSGRIERIYILPGAWVEEDSVIMEMSNPELVQEALNAELELKAAEADYVSYKVDLQSNLLQLQSVVAQLNAEYKEAQIQLEINTELLKDGLESALTTKLSRLRAEQLATRLELEKQRLAFGEQAIETQLSARDLQREQVIARSKLLQEQLEGLSVKAGFAGVLQRQNVEEGQQVTTGQSLSQVANPKSLKAVIRVSEHQAKDVMIDQNALVDTRNGKVAGRVSRVDPNVESGTVEVDVELIGELPKGARPDLTVEGVIELENLPNVVFVEKPIYASAGKTTSVYRFVGGSNIAERVPVTFGRSSVNTIEVLSGLETGERIVISDTSDWDRFDRMQLK